MAASTVRTDMKMFLNHAAVIYLKKENNMATKKKKAGTNKKAPVAIKNATAARKSTAKGISVGKKKPVASRNTASESNPFDVKLKVVTPSGAKDVNFFEMVFDVARQVPKGRVTSYGAIAAAIGARGWARQVGWAMHAAGSAKPKVPAHRVVNSSGVLSGKHHFNPPGKMEELLKKEGIKVKNDKIVDFKKLFWDPSEEF